MVFPDTNDVTPDERPRIIPTPRHISYSDVVISLLDAAGRQNLILIAEDGSGRRAARVFNRQMELSGIRPFRIDSVLSDDLDATMHSIVFSENDETRFELPQAYNIRVGKNGTRYRIHAWGYDQTGCIYAAVSLAQLVIIRDHKTEMHLADIEDAPDFSERIFHGLAEPENMDEILDWMVRFKMECLVVNNRKYSWWAMDPELDSLLQIYDNWQRKYGGVTLMQPHNLYQGRHIVISDDEDRSALKQVLAAGLRHGTGRIIILADDTPPFRFGEGYILTSEHDKARFRHMADAHCDLMADLQFFIDERYPDCRLYYVPAFYTYEEMHYGDMNLYRDTPWEAAAFEPLERDLAYIGSHLPQDVQIIWSGPHVRSRVITDEDLFKWTQNLNGRVPYLWDNTIYSHYPFTSSAMLTAYDNQFPDNFHQKTGGNGMFVNGDIADELNRPSAMTVNDYLWNASAYQPDRSLRAALGTLYGVDAVCGLLEFREIEMQIRELIGAADLWFQADTLWRMIRRIRFTTEKNPFYYHLNYSRLKALRLQLKNSISEPPDSDELERRLRELDRRRKEIIASLKTRIPEKLSDALVNSVVPVTDRGSMED